jgi:hypothetical protein
VTELDSEKTEKVLAALVEALGLAEVDVRLIRQAVAGTGADPQSAVMRAMQRAGWWAPFPRTGPWR